MATWDDIRTIAATLPETVERKPREWLARVPKKLSRAYRERNP
jgi:hypothetical protein